MEESTDQDWIACDGCEEWYHLKCIGLTKKAAAKVAVYQCDNCRVSLLLLLPLVGCLVGTDHVVVLALLLARPRRHPLQPQRVPGVSLGVVPAAARRTMQDRNCTACAASP